MSAQHTPGPWTQGKSEIGVKCVWLNGATEPKGEMGPSHTWIECGTKANACLIAAAPELLLVTQGFRRKLATYVSVYPGDKELRRLLDECNAAIAKAIG